MLTTGVYCALGAAVYFLWNPCCSFFNYFLCVVLSCVRYVPSSVLWCRFRFRHKNDVLSLPPQLVMGWLRSYLRYVCLRIVVSTYIVLCFSSSCGPYVASFSVFLFVLWTLCCQFLCVSLRLVDPMLPVSLCFSSSCGPYVASFSVFFFVLWTLCCQFLCVFLRLVDPMLPVSLCFSSSCGPYVASFSVFFFVLWTLCCQFLCVFLRLVDPMLPVSLCFSSSCGPYVASFSVFFFVLWTLCCQFLCVSLRLVDPMLPVSLCFSSSCGPCCQFLCFSSSCGPYVASFSGLSMFDCLFGILLRLFMVKISIHQCFFSSFKAILFFECICIYFRSDV